MNVEISVSQESIQERVRRTQTLGNKASTFGGALNIEGMSASIRNYGVDKNEGKETVLFVRPNTIPLHGLVH